VIVGGNYLYFCNVAEKLFSHEEVDTLLWDFVDFNRVAIWHAYELLVMGLLLGYLFRAVCGFEEFIILFYLKLT
jgi:hypothetical protein